MSSLSCILSVYFEHLNETEITCDCSFAARSSHCRSYRQNECKIQEKIQRQRTSTKMVPQNLTLKRWVRHTWRALCPQERLHHGVVSLSPEEGRAGSYCRMGAAPEMGGDTAPLSYPPKPCPPATTGAHCWGKSKRKRESENLVSLMEGPIIESLQSMYSHLLDTPCIHFILLCAHRPFRIAGYIELSYVKRYKLWLMWLWTWWSSS